MTLGMVVRADLGGLAVQSEECFRHLHPAKTLLIDLGPKGRGPTRPERYWQDWTELRVVHGYPEANGLAWLCDGIDTIYTAEGTYGPDLPVIAARTNTRLVIHANPELWDEEQYRGPSTVVTTPTTWEINRISHATHLPMPVARDRLPFRRRTEARTFLHMMAPAMEDRNGWRLVDASLRLVRSRVQVIVAGNLGRLRPRRVGAVQVKALGPQQDYWTVYDQADVLILPRRYGGLSLPIQEAMGVGLAVITLDLEPYAPMLHPAGLVPAINPTPTHMRGGDFDVWDARPRALAEAIDRFASDPALVAECSDASDAAASKLAWDALLPEWQRVVG